MRKIHEYNRTYKGTVIIELQNETYDVSVLAKATYYWQPEVRYFKDGTGQPEDEDITVHEIIVDKILKEDQSSFGVWNDMTDLYETNKAFKADIDEELYSKLEDEWYNYDWEGEEDFESDYESDDD